MKRWIAIALLGLGVAHAAPEDKVPVFVAHTGRGGIVASMAYEVREAVRQSAGLRLTATKEEAKLIVRLTLLDTKAITGDETNVSVAMGWAIAQPFPFGSLEALSSSGVMVCGKNVLAACGRDMAAHIDDEAIGVSEFAAKKNGKPTR